MSRNGEDRVNQNGENRVNPIRSPRGVHDILPPETARWRQFEAAFAAFCDRAGYGELRLPMFEELGVFLRLGQDTEVVSKEMYDFVDKDGKHMALRPEMTASAARAFIQHSPTVPWKVYYHGPQFRCERPQAGRYRQFSQAGIEVFGVSDPYLDVEVIALGWEFLKSLGLAKMSLHINSLGDTDDRAAYGEQLRNYFAERADELSEASRKTAETNPLRVLDSKREQDQDIIAEAPSCLDFLSDAASERSDAASKRFEVVCEGLRQLEIDFQINPKLVRGLDYYTHTAFEYVSEAFEGAQNALGGGGHYSGLVEALGGKDSPGVGFALGIDRIFLACDSEGVFAFDPSGIDIFVVDIVGGQEALVLTHQLRMAGISCDRAWGNRSMKAQMKLADRSGAEFALIVGSDEQEAGAVGFRDLRSDQFVKQENIPRDEIVDELRKRLAPQTQ